MKLLVLTPATLMMSLMIAAAAVVQAGGSGAATAGGSSGCRGDSALRCAAPPQNCSTVLQAAIDAAAGVGGAGALCIGGTWAVLPIALRSNLLLQLTADATVIAQRGAFHGGADHLVNVLGVRNVSIRGAVGGGSRLAMWKSDYTDTKLYSHSEGRHALYIMESRHVRISDLEIEDPGGDSVYLGGSVGGGPATDVELLRVVSRNAYRNGLSITGARDVVVQSCSFLNTSGTPPEAGIDIEPNDPFNWIHNISFYDLQSRWNRGSGISLALGKLSCAKLRRPCHHPAECICPKDPPAVTITVAGAQIQGVSELGLNGSSMIQGLDFNIGVFISAGLNESRGSFNFTDVSVNETVQPGLEFEDKAALNLPVRFVNCSWSHVATAKTVRWGGQNVPLLLHQAEYNAIGGITFDHCSVGDGAEARPWLKCDSCGSRGPALGITGDVTVTNSAGCRTDNIPAGGLAITCDRVPASTSSSSSSAGWSVRFAGPTLVGSSNLSRPNASHFWFPAISIATGIPGHVAQHITLSGDGGTAPHSGEEIMLTRDGGMSYTVVKRVVPGTSGTFNGYGDLGTFVPPNNESSRRPGNFRSIVGCNDCAGGSVDKPAFLQSWLDSTNEPGGGLRLVAKQRVSYFGTPPSFGGNLSCGTYGNGRPKRCGLNGPSGSIVRTAEGSLLASFYGYATDGPMLCAKGKRLCMTVALYSSVDGLHWTYTSRIDQTAAMPSWGSHGGSEGPGEPSLVALADGRVLIVFRLQSNPWYTEFNASEPTAYGMIPLWQSYSTTAGRTWSSPVPMRSIGTNCGPLIAPHAVWPQLRLLQNGALVLSSGRPGIGLWVSQTGAGERWAYHDVQAEHTRLMPTDPFTSGDSATTAYTSLSEVEPGVLLLAYDKFGNEKVQNSTVEKVYSMRVTITRTWRTQLKSDDSAVSPLELFVRYSGDLQKPTALPTVLAMMDKARACGYDGMLYDDSAIPSLHIKGRTNATFYSNWEVVRSHAEHIGLKLNLAIFPFGYSASIFSQPGYGYQLAEPLKFSGARFRVASDKTHLVSASMYGGIDNGGFDSHNGDLIKGWKQDAPSQRTFVESGQTCRSGGSCLRIGPGAHDAQVWQEMRGVGKLSQVQVSFWAKSSAFAATQYNVELRSLLNRGNDSTTARGRRLSWSWLNVNRTQDWAQYHFVATTWDDREPVALFIGFEQRADGPAPVQQGSIFFDDISVAETAFINVLEREGAPLVARAGNRVLSEGQDFDRVVDPMYPRGLWPQYEAGTSWFSCQWPAAGYPDTHPTPVVTLPNSTTLSPGEVVTFDYFAVLPVLGSVPSCLTHPAIAQYMHESAGAVALLQPSGMLMSYDEIHIMRNDHDEMSRFATAGELLASHVANATKIARSAVNTAKRKNNSAPNVRLFAWADMFNPDHNSGNHYFLVNGTLEGAWRGIERGLEGVTMMTWGPCNDSAPSKPGQPPCKYRAGLEFFADRGIHQFLGGYYDTHDGTKSARDEWSYQKGVRNVDGFMYTTWGSNNPQNGGQPDYTQMCPYAKELRRLSMTPAAAKDGSGEADGG